jgi:hypothetical protein
VTEAPPQPHNKRHRPSRPPRLRPKPHQPNFASSSSSATINSLPTLRFWANNPYSLNGSKKDELASRLEWLRQSRPNDLPQIIFLCETWFTSESDVLLDGYNLHSLDRSEIKENNKINNTGNCIVNTSRRRRRRRRNIQDEANNIDNNGNNYNLNIHDNNDGDEHGENDDQFEKEKRSRGGGVAIYVQKEIDVRDTHIPQLDNPDTEQVWKVVRIANESFLLGCIYRPKDRDDEVLVKIMSSIELATKSLNKLNCFALLVYGDFNFSHTYYDQIDVGGGVATVAHVLDDRPADQKFQECLNENHLTQLVTFPTYRHSLDAASTNTLDLVITDDPDRLIKIEPAESPFGYTPKGRAHFPICGSLAVAWHETRHEPSKPRLIWSKANFESISAYIAAFDWESIMEGLSASDSYEILVKKYQEAIKLYVPTSTTPLGPRKSPWMTAAVLDAVKHKREMWAKNRAAGRRVHEQLKKDYQMACKAVDKAVKSAVCNYEQDLGTAAKSDPKLIHAYVRSKQKVRENISLIETARGYVTSGQDEICLTLND